MPLFTTLAALSQTPANNPPDGAVDAPSTIDDQMRLLGSFIAQLRDGTGFTVSALLPPGTGADYFGGVVPSGWLLCDGSAVSRTTYSALFAAISTIWGAGDGSTTFNLPDLRRRTTIGAGGVAVSGPTNSLASTGGEETHALTTAELAAHNHTVNITDPGHTHAASVTDPGHAHSSNAAGNGSTGSTGAGVPLFGVTATTSSGTGITVANSSAATGITAASVNAGSGTAHNNMQPSAVVNKIIKT